MPSGYFKAPLVPPGTYTVTISAKGFGTYSAKAVPVTVGSMTELHPELKTGSTQETVEVSGVAPVHSVSIARGFIDIDVAGDREPAAERWPLVEPGLAYSGRGIGLQWLRPDFLPRHQPDPQQC